MKTEMGESEWNQGALDRRHFLKVAGAASVAAWAGRCGAASQKTSAASGTMPNIVYILADDLGYGDVRCFNPDSKIPVPNLDRIAKEGVIFTDAHSGSAVCTPTRYGILTGRYCWRSPLKAHVLEGHHPPLIPPERLTVASMLKARGYRTACIGKWHLGLGWGTTDGQPPRLGNLDYSASIKGGPNTVGFDYFFGIPASLDMPPYLFVENDRVVAAPDGVIPYSKAPAYFRGGPIAKGFRHEDVLPALAKKAVECIDEQASAHAGQPLFLYFPLTAPHTPVIPTAEFQGKSPAGVYGDFVCEVDAVVGQVLDALERNQMLENTLVIFTSDNGFAPMAGLSQLQAMGHEPSYHFRGTKADIFEGGHRIPFMARWPEKIKAGTVSDHLIGLTDLMATTAEITGYALPDNAGEDSISMLGSLRGTVTASARSSIVHHSANGLFSIRDGFWKLECCPGSGGWSEPKDADAVKMGLPPVQLYDLATDYAERTNVQGDHPEIVERLTKLLEQYIAQGRSTPGAPQSNEGETLIWGEK